MSMFNLQQESISTKLGSFSAKEPVLHSREANKETEK